MARQKSPRMRKVNELVREVVADAVQDLKDPRIGFLTITGVETSPDLRYAVVYYSVLGSEEDKTGTAAALQSAKARIQGALGRETRMRYTPVLDFKVDPSIDEGIRINQILAGLDDRDREQDDA
ncbi:MAG: ribosome-binding factor A [Acidimicrobiia bacterium]|nr:MAG: ribosome-binding factor A [Acidimicrobiia bacterium]